MLYSLTGKRTLRLATVVAALVSASAGLADELFDQGVSLFKRRDYVKAAATLEKSIANAPWESSSYYYCALSYHYAKDFKRAAEKYAALVEKFPGTQASQNAEVALRQVDPGYFSRKKSQHQKKGGLASAGGESTSKEQDKGTVEGDPQTRVYFAKQGDSALLDVKVGGKAIKAALDQHGESTAFSRGQLQALGIQVQPGQKEARVDLALGGVVRKNFPISVDDSVGTEPKIGKSFLDAFIYQIDDRSNTLSLTRKSGTGSASSEKSGPQVSFNKQGKDIIVQAEVNGRSSQMIFDPNADGIVLSVRQARGLGLKVDDAEEKYQSPAELPQRGDPNWVPPEDRQAAPKFLNASRFKFGPIDKSNITLQVTEKESKYPTMGAGVISGYKFDIDYQSNVIRFSKR